MNNQLMKFSKIDYSVAMFMIGGEQWMQLKTVVESLGLDTGNLTRVAERLPEDYKKLVDMKIFDSAEGAESEAYRSTNPTKTISELDDKDKDALTISDPIGRQQKTADCIGE